MAEIDLGGIINLIESYNKKFSGNASVIREVIDEEGYPMFDEEKTRLIEEKIEQLRESAFNKILANHKTDLGRTGLGIETIEDEVPVGFAETGKVSRLKVRFNLKDGKSFMNYLDDLRGQPLGDKQISDLNYIVNSLVNQLEHEYNLGDANDERMIELVSNLEKIIKKFQELNKGDRSEFSELIIDLSKYLEIARKKYLKEYLLLQRTNLFDKNGELKLLGDWMFGAGDYARKYWDTILDVLREMNKNPNAKEFQNKTVKYLQECLNSMKVKLKGGSEDENIMIDEVYDELENLK